MSEQLFKRADDALFSEVGNDVVALNVQRGQCYGMEDVSAIVWSLQAERDARPEDGRSGDSMGLWCVGG